MTSNYVHQLEIRGVSALIGEVIPMDTWAARMQVPDRKGTGSLSGARIQEVLGVQGKSWEPALFGRPETITGVARAALASAKLHPDDIDALIVVTCTAFELNLGQDGFRFARDLGLRDDAVVFQLEAGCGGLARAMHVANGIRASRILMLAYNLPSPITQREDRAANPVYLQNRAHPMKDLLWASPGIFSDGAGAMVLERTRTDEGVSFYSRDQRAFGDGPGFRDPIVHYLGGGALRPVGYDDNAQLMGYVMSGKIIAEYYNKGMLLNHEMLLSLRPTYVEDMKRIYTHQAGPAMVKKFVDISGIPEDKAPTSATRLGNLVSPCTIHLLQEDIDAGRVVTGDEVCFEVVGAGPERGAFTLPYRVREPVRTRDFIPN